MYKYIIKAYDFQTKNGYYTRLVDIEIIEKTCELGIQKSKEIINRNYHEIIKIIEL